MESRYHPLRDRGGSLLKGQNGPVGELWAIGPQFVGVARPKQCHRVGPSLLTGSRNQSSKLLQKQEWKAVRSLSPPTNMKVHGNPVHKTRNAFFQTRLMLGDLGVAVVLGVLSGAA